MPLQEGYKTPKLLLKKAKSFGPKKTKKAKEPRKMSMAVPKEDASKKKMGKVTRRKQAGTTEPSLMDARAITDYEGKKMAKEFMEKGRLKYEQRLNKMLKNMK